MLVRLPWGQMPGVPLCATAAAGEGVVAVEPVVAAVDFDVAAYAPPAMATAPSAPKAATLTIWSRFLFMLMATPPRAGCGSVLSACMTALGEGLEAPQSLQWHS